MGYGRKKTRRFLLFIPVFLLAALLWSGCSRLAGDANDRLGDTGQRGPGRETAQKFSPQQILGPDFMEAPAEEGIYVVSAGGIEAQDGLVLHIQGYQMNQRAIRIIENRMKKDIPVLIQEAQEQVFAEGVIAEIETGDAGSVRKIFVQGNDKQDSAHVSIAGYTQIFKEGQQPKTAYGKEVLNIGQKIKVEIVGAALMTLPPQASASTITIRSD